MAEEQVVDDLNEEVVIEPEEAAGQDEAYAPETTLAEDDQNVADKQEKKKKKVRRRKNFFSQFSAFEWTMIILGILLGAIMIAGFTYLYKSAQLSIKAVPKTGIIASDTDKSWETRVVNSSSGLGSEFAVATSAVTGTNGVQVDSRITKDATEMLAALKNDIPDEDVNLLIGYTSITDFIDAFNNRVNQFLDEGYSEAQAQARAANTVAVPGTDEHSLGLLVNFGLGQTLDPASFKATKSYEWLKNNGWQYGFIERYPEGKESITLHPADPTAFRYVGVENAEKIYESGQSLEEYNAAVAQQQAEAAAQQAAEEAAQAQAQAEAQAQDQAAQAGQ